MAELAADLFNAGAGDLSANWTDQAAFGAGFEQTSTSAIAGNSGGNDAATYWNAVSWPADQYSEIIFSTVGARGLGAGYGPSVRCSGTGTLYRLVACGSGYELNRIVATSGTALASSAGTTFATGDTLRLEVSGVGATVTLKMFKNGVQFGGDISDTNAARLVSGSSGMGHSSTTSLGDGITSWSGGDLTAGDVTAPTYSVNPYVTSKTPVSAMFAAIASDPAGGDTAVDHYLGVYASGATPTAANIIAGAGTGFLAGSARSGINVANGVATDYGTVASPIAVSAGTTYDAFATVQEHGATKNPATPYKVTFTTLSLALVAAMGNMSLLMDD